MTAHYLLLLVLLPLAGGLVVLCLPERFSSAARPLALGWTGMLLLAGLPLAATYNPKDPAFQWLDTLGGTGGVHLGIDGLSIVLILTCALVGIVGIGGAGRRVGGWLLMTSGAVGVLVALNLWLLTVSWLLMASGAAAVPAGVERGRWRLSGRDLSVLAGAGGAALLVITIAAASSAQGWVTGVGVPGLLESSLPRAQQWLIFGGGLSLLVTGSAFLLLPMAGAAGDAPRVLVGSVTLTLALYVVLRVALPLAPDVSRTAAPVLGYAAVACAVVCAAVAAARAHGTAKAALYGVSQTAVVVAGASTLSPGGLSGAVPHQAVVALSMVALAMLGGDVAAVLPGAAETPSLRRRMRALAVVAVALIAVGGLTSSSGARVQAGAVDAERVLLVVGMAVAGLFGVLVAIQLARPLWSASPPSAGTEAPAQAAGWGWVAASAVGLALLVAGPVQERVTVPALKIAARLDPSYQDAFDAACDTTVTDELKAANPANQFLSAAPCGPNGEPLPAGSMVEPTSAAVAGRWADARTDSGKIRPEILSRGLGELFHKIRYTPLSARTT